MLIQINGIIGLFASLNLQLLRQAHTGPVFNIWPCLCLCLCVCLSVTTFPMVEESIYSPEISQIQGAEDGLTRPCVEVIPWRPPSLESRE